MKCGKCGRMVGAFGDIECPQGGEHAVPRSGGWWGSVPTPVMTGALARPGASRQVEFRLLECSTCHAVWPTIRSDADGGARADGEPCAYRWPTGRVCRGHVHVRGFTPHGAAYDYPIPTRPAYAGRWCDVLGVAWGTRDLAVIRRHYRALAKQRHPDAGGTHEAMRDLNEAYRQALAELDGAPGETR